MNSVDPNSTALYFTAAASAANQMTAEAARKKEKTSGTSRFSSLLKSKQEENFFVSQGLPAELMGLSEEEAIVYLKDQVDMAGDALSISASIDKFENYKKAVSQFVKYIEKNNYVIREHKRFGRSRRGKQRDPAIQIITINEKLDRLAYDLWYNHLDKLRLLEKIHEINGLIIDLMAA